MTATAIAKTFKPNEVMTLGELYALLAGFRIRLGCFGRRNWTAWCSVAAGEEARRVEAKGATPRAAVEGLLKRIGGGS